MPFNRLKDRCDLHHPLTNHPWIRYRRHFTTNHEIAQATRRDSKLYISFQRKASEATPTASSCTVAVRANMVSRIKNVAVFCSKSSIANWEKKHRDCKSWHKNSVAIKCSGLKTRTLESTLGYNNSAKEHELKGFKFTNSRNNDIANLSEKCTHCQWDTFVVPLCIQEECMSTEEHGTARWSPKILRNKSIQIHKLFCNSSVVRILWLPFDCIRYSYMGKNDRLREPGTSPTYQSPKILTLNEVAW